MFLKTGNIIRVLNLNTNPSKDMAELIIAIHGATSMSLNKHKNNTYYINM
jgi:hypothetical protein